MAANAKGPMTMEKRIELEMRGREPEEVRELNLDNCRATNGTLAGLDVGFDNLEALSLINCGLTTLKGFPKLSNLKRLELSDNRIPNGLDNLSVCPNLTYINLSGNKISQLEELEPLKEHKSLKTLDFFNCEIAKLDDYREGVFKLLPQIKYLDGFDIDDNEAEETEPLIDVDEDEEDIDPEDEEAADSDDDNEDEDETEDFAEGEENGDVDDDVEDDEESGDEGADAGDDSNVSAPSESKSRKRKHDDEGEDDEDSQD